MVDALARPPASDPPPRDAAERGQAAAMMRRMSHRASLLMIFGLSFAFWGGTIYLLERIVH